MDNLPFYGRVTSITVMDSCIVQWLRDVRFHTNMECTTILSTKSILPFYNDSKFHDSRFVSSPKDRPTVSPKLNTQHSKYPQEIDLSSINNTKFTNNDHAKIRVKNKSSDRNNRKSLTSIYYESKKFQDYRCTTSNENDHYCFSNDSALGSSLDENSSTCESVVVSDFDLKRRKFQNDSDSRIKVRCENEKIDLLYKTLISEESGPYTKYPSLVETYIYVVEVHYLI
uniref:Uncharacterized protein n=1 Tax=Romanomermis culicivorax TaxID=13658 RepID=A0A915I9M0_ROMCU